MLKFLENFLRDESGATAVEYGLIAGFVSGAAIVALTSMGNSLAGMFTAVSGRINAAVAAVP